MAAAQGRTGIAQDAIKAAKDAGCEAFTGSGPIDCDVLVEWFADHPEVLKEHDNGTIQTEKLLDARAIRRTRELKLDQMKGELIPTEEAIMELARVIVACKVTLLGGIQSLALKLAADTGGDQIMIGERIRAWAMESLRELSESKFDHACPHCKVKL